MKSKEEVLQLVAELEADYETIADLFQKNTLMTQKIEQIEPDEFAHRNYSAGDHFKRLVPRTR